MLRTSGMPMGQPNCTVLMSSPMILRSWIDSERSQRRTGSVPDAVA